MSLELLTIGNPKTQKSVAHGYRTAVLHLAPHKSARVRGEDSYPVNVCPHASPGCIASCLNRAGRGAIDATQQARIRRTDWLVNGSDFVDALDRDIERIVRKAERERLRVAIRLNGTSDLDWSAGPTVRRWHNKVTFYDYTKDPHQAFRPGLRKVCFSRSEANETDTLSMLRSGVQVAFVADAPTFAARRRIVVDWIRERMPAFTARYSDGDQHDLIWKHGQVVVLSPKGPAKRDKTGFVLR